MREATGGDFDFPRRFAVALASGALAGVGGGGGLDESTEDVYIPVLIRSWLNKVGLGCPMSGVRLGFFYLCGGSGGRQRRCAEIFFDIYGGFPDFTGGNCVRKGCELGASGVSSLDLGGLIFCPSLIFFGSSGEDLERYVSQLAKPGWFLPTTCSSGGYVPLLGVLSYGVKGFLEALEAPDSCSSGDAMVDGHLLRLGCSTVKMYADEVGILLMVPLQTCQSSRRRSASRSKVLRPPAATTTGRMTVQGLCCNFYFLQGCLCKSWNVTSLTFI